MTLAPPRGRATTPLPTRRPPAPAVDGPSQSPRTALHLLVAELALFGLSAATLIGCARLFTRNDYLGTTLIVAALAHLGCAIGRRLHWRRLFINIFASVLATGALVWLEFGATSWGPIPTGSTVSALSSALDASWTTYRAQLAPVPPLVGFTVVLALTAVLIALISDSLAFGLAMATEAILPATIVFAFTSIIGAPDRPRIAFAAAFVAAVLVFWVAHRAWDQAHQNTWFGQRTTGATRATLLIGASIALIATLIAAALASASPKPKPLVNWRDERPDRGSRTTDSPLAAIRQRLGDSPAVVAFTVTADEPHYWRLTALEEFDGSQWATSDSYRDAKGSLPTAPEPEGGKRKTVKQVFDIDVLQSIWLPTAYRPGRVRGDGIKASFSDDSGSLLTDLDSANGLSYTAESDVLDMTGPELAQAVASNNKSPKSLAKYLKVPTLPATLTDLAAQITTGSTNDFDKARAIQDYFQSGEYSYDLTVDSGHSLDRMVDFVVNQKRGFCEQFAATYALLARAAGVPARVAVGFTPGDANGTGYTVSNRHAHAWPEVYLAPIGWVAFEPTPGRGIPGADSYTGLPPEQAAPDDPNQSAPTPTASVPTTSALDSAGATSTSLVEADIVPEAATPSRGLSPLKVGGAILGAILLLIVLLVVAIAAVGRRRRHKAVTPGSRALLAWSLASEQLRRVGIRRSASETPDELAGRASKSLGISEQATRRLAQARTEATFSPTSVTESHVEQAEAAAEMIEQSVVKTRSRLQRLTYAVDPRRLRALPD